MNRDLGTYLLFKGMVAKGNLDLRDLNNNTVNAGKKNEKLLFKILKDSQNCEFGKKHNFASIKSIEDYRKQVPMTTYEDYLPYIQRMIDNNEEDILCSYPLVAYAQTSGTTGKHKFIPLTQKVINLYQKYTLTTMVALVDRHCRQKYGRPLKPGRGLFICLEFEDKLPNGRAATNVPEITAKQLSWLYPYLTNVPFKKLFKLADISGYYLYLRFALEDKNTMYIFGVFFSFIYEMLHYLKANWEVFVDDIANGTISDLARPTPEVREEMMKFIKPNPERAAELRKEFEKGFDETILQRIWPNLSVIYGIANSVYTSYADNVRKISGDIPFDYSIYGASEGLFATPDNLDDGKRLLLPDSCFFEFIPVDEPDKILMLDELEIGKEYELVITNQAGLYRYRLGDIIEVAEYKNQCPYIVFSRRKGHLISITGEKTAEHHLEEVIRAVSNATGVDIHEWVVYVNNDTHPGHYTLAIENDSGKDLSVYTDMAEELLRKVNPIYDRFRRVLGIKPLTIVNQKPGSHDEWIDHMVEKGTARTQVKPVRVLDNKEKIDFFLERII